MCTYSGRSDHVKTHVRTVHADGADGWIAKPKNPSVFINSKMTTALCVKCGTGIKGNDDYCYLTLAQLHSCKPKQERAARDVPVLAPRQAPTAPAGAESGPPLAAVWEKCKAAIKKLPLPAKKRKNVNVIIRNNEDLFLDDEADYEQLLINVMADLANGVELECSEDEA